MPNITLYITTMDLGLIKDLRAKDISVSRLFQDALRHVTPLKAERLPKTLKQRVHEAIELMKTVEESL